METAQNFYTRNIDAAVHAHLQTPIMHKRILKPKLNFFEIILFQVIQVPRQSNEAEIIFKGIKNAYVVKEKEKDLLAKLKAEKDVR